MALEIVLWYLELDFPQQVQKENETSAGGNRNTFQKFVWIPQQKNDTKGNKQWGLSQQKSFCKQGRVVTACTQGTMPQILQKAT